MKKVIPVIKKSRTITQEYEVCPHCQKEIGEKETFVDKENYRYHRPCFAKGPIEKIKVLSDDELARALGWKNS